MTTKCDAPRLRDLFYGERGLTGLGASALVVFLGAVVLLIALSSGPAERPRVELRGAVAPPVEPAPPFVGTVTEVPKYVWHAWPPTETVIAPAKAVLEEKKNADVSSRALPEPAPPTAAEIREIAAWPKEGAETLGKARELLLDPARSSTLKLAAIERLREWPTSEAVPILVEFLRAPALAGNAATKPTAIKVLVDRADPLATAAIHELAKDPPDEIVRLSIASFAATVNLEESETR